MQLSKPQLEAVNYLNGPTLVCSGPGAGKSRVVVSKFEHLINDLNYDPKRILCITFTNKAANELIERLVKATRRSKRDFPWVRTFHSAMFQVIKQHYSLIGYDLPLTIYDTKDQNTLLKRLLNEEFDIDDKKLLYAIKSHIGTAKNTLNPLEELHKIKKIKKLPDIYESYQEELKKANCMDFDDILQYAYYIFNQYPKVAESYRQWWQYILLDEHQDSNDIQNAIVGIIYNKNNLTVVGDDFQCFHKNGTVRIKNEVGFEKDIKVSDIKVGDLVKCSNSIFTNNSYYNVTAVNGPIKRKTVTIKCRQNVNLTVSREHKCFVYELAPKINNKEYYYYVFLGYDTNRLFYTTIYFGDTYSEIINKIKTDNIKRLWLLKQCTSPREAVFYENFISLNYQIPKIQTYYDKHLSQQDSLTLSKVFGKNGYNLFNILNGYHFDYPNIVNEDTCSRHDKSEQFIYVIMNHDTKYSKVNKTLVKYNFENINIKKFFTNYKDAVLFAENLQKENFTNGIIEYYESYSNQYLNIVPANSICVGMKTVLSYGTDQLEEIIDVVKSTDEEEVYDVEVADTGFIAVDHIISHNSIYRFRGAQPKHFINFSKKYENTKIVYLEENYRCTKEIVDLSSNIIEHNKNQLPKKCFSNKTGPKPNLNMFSEEKNEASYVAKRCLEYSKQGIPFSEMAVLYRAKFISRVFEKEFNYNGIPYKLIGSVGFFDRKEIKDLVSYLQCAINNKDDVAFERILNVPKRGIGSKTIKTIRSIKVPSLSLMEKAEIAITQNTVSKKIANEIRILLDILKDIKDMSATDAIETVFERIKYDNYLDSLVESDEELNNRLENITELHYISQDKPSIAKFLEDCALIRDEQETKDEKDENDNKVRFSTIHAVKGLQFQCVFVVAIEENLLPHYRSYDEIEKEKVKENIEEERRLLYVAVTRSSQHLHLSNSMTRQGKQKNPSRFITELSTKHFKK